ncbi:calcium-binding protein [Psychrobium sp. nBUS_13]|uniref:calcium-binding protein n=1 Tax=Psychrobium sp. nBUS_13 TaxID=3395319 RepID=UPI003EC01A24
MTIKISSAQLAQMIFEFQLNTSLPNYSGFYHYIAEHFGDQLDAVNKKHRYWFEEATDINFYLNDVVDGVLQEEPTQSAYFIQQINKESLKIASRTNPAVINSDENIKNISNAIGRNLYQDIIAENQEIMALLDDSEVVLQQKIEAIIAKYPDDNIGELPKLSEQVAHDINAAIDEGKLSLSQWGGAFYFWDTVLPAGTKMGGSEVLASPKKVGDIIVDAGNRDQFVEMTAIAMAKTLEKFGLGGDGSGTALLGALGTFSYGYTEDSGANMAAIIPALLGMPIIALASIPMNDQETGLRVALRTAHEFAKLHDIDIVDMSKVAYDDLLSYFSEVGESAVEGVDTVGAAILNLFEDTQIGTSDADELDGGWFIGVGDDVLFGLGGDDTLDGGIGNDRLYGGDNNDRLEGGSGNDELFGGTGNDTLIGGEDRDILSGGAGADTYKFNTGDGFDTLIDSTHDGDKIFINDVDISTLNFTETLEGSGTYINGDITLIVFDGQLQIKSDVDGKQSWIQVNHFRNGDFGLNLQDYAGLEDVSNTLEVVVNEGSELGLGEVKRTGSQSPNDAEVINGLNGNDYLVSWEGDDQIYGGDGDDVINGGDGNDYLVGGEGRDYISGFYSELDGGQDDVLIANDIDILTDDERMHGEGSSELGDALSGDNGDDTLVGSKASDVLLGGAGKDIIYGAAGNDYIRGDGFGNFFHVITDEETNEKEYSTHWTVTEDAKFGLIFSPLNLDISPLGGDADLIFAGGGNDIVWGNYGDDLLYGEEGDDELFGAEGNDILYGGVGNDVLYGDFSWEFGVDSSLISGEDTLHGGVGDDILLGGAGNDNLYGGAGDDLLVGDEDDDTLSGGDGDDELNGGIGNDTIGGGIGDDLIFGGEDDDVLSGGDGDDKLNGGIGNDILDGGVGGDVLHGEAGEDLLYGDHGNDFLYGGDNDDILDGGVGNDQLTGDAGDDKLHGGSGDDNLFGGIGEDILYGNENNDQLVGGSGNDELHGGAGDDKIFGEDGDDILYGDRGDDELNGGIGNDTIGGGIGDDLIFGGEGDDVLSGGDGDDQLSGNDGDDTLHGESGIDIITGGVGEDKLFGGSGNDELFGDDGNDTLDGGFGNDELQGHAGDDILYGKDGADKIVGGSGSDNLYGGSGNDGLYGGIGNDLLLGESGDDILNGNAGNDSLTGGEGNDTLLGDIGSDELSGGVGDDWLNGGANDDTLHGGAGDDELIGEAGSDELNGDTGNDKLFGKEGDDILYGGEGNDQLSGGVGNDELYGSAGNDRLYGGEGNDILYGGLGHNILSGEDGNDVIYVGSGGGLVSGGKGNDIINIGSRATDIIYNYGDGIDTINGVTDGYLVFDFEYNQYSFGIALGSLAIMVDGVAVVHFEDFKHDDLDQAPVFSGVKFSDGVTFSYDDILALGFDLAGTSESDTLNGTSGDDRFETFDGNDVIYAKAGNDTLDGGSGADQMYGMAGDDIYIVDDAGDEVIELADEGYDIVESEVDYVLGDNVEALTLKGEALKGTGNVQDNVIEGNTANNSIFGGDGDDTLRGNDGNDIIHGGNGSDKLYGGEQNDELHGGADNDTLSDYRGQNILHGNDGDDNVYGKGQLFGDDGNDRLSGSGTLNGGNGDDVLTGTGILNGGSGNDTLEGAGTLNGDAGDDIVKGRNNDDVLMGGIGNDTLTGLDGDDIFIGGAGNDILVGGLINGNNTYEFSLGDGTDTIKSYKDVDNDIYTNKIRFISGVSPTDVKVSRASNGDLYLNYGLNDRIVVGLFFVENAWGQQGDIDQITFEDGTQWNYKDILAKALIGDDLDNRIDGYDSNDTIIGGDGNDVLFGNRGYDIIHGNDGNDKLYGDGELFGNAGQDTLKGIGILNGGAGDDILTGSSYIYDRTSEDELLSGKGRVNILIGGAGNDILNGRFGHDTYQFSVGDGIDTINNNNTPDGGDYNAIFVDTINFTSGILPDDITIIRADDDLHINYGSNDRIVVTGFFIDGGNTSAAIDQINFDDGTQWSKEELLARLLIGDNLDNEIAGYTTDDTLEGNVGNDVLVDYQGSNVLHGGEGDDQVSGIGQLFGDDGNDTLSGKGSLDGGNGNDTLISEGDSVLIGGKGNDKLVGSFKQETYLFNIGDGSDLIIETKPDQAYSNVTPSKDILQFGSSISLNDLSFERHGNNLVIAHANGTDKITVQNWYQEPTDHFKINSFEFDDGTSLSNADIQALVVTHGTDEAENLLGYRNENDQIHGGAGNDKIWGRAGNDEIHGDDGNDYLDGEVGNDILFGEAGDDQLIGRSGNDSLDGGAGNDYLDGGTGDDVLITGDGDDRVVIKDNGGHDVVHAGGNGTSGILFSDTLSIDRLNFTKDGDDLLISVDDGSSQSIRVINHFLGGDSSIAWIQPAGSYLLQTAQINQLAEGGEEQNNDFDSVKVGTENSEQVVGTSGKDLIQGLDGADQLFGLSGNDRIEGGSGNDQLYGGNGSRSGSGDDVIIGGEGNDILVGEDGNDYLDGGSGDDHYYYYAGTGKDIISDEDSGQDILFFNDVALDRLSYHQDGNDLIVRVDGDSGQQVRVENHFTGGDSEIMIQASTGYTQNASAIAAQLTPLPTETGGGEAGGGETGGGETGGGEQSTLISMLAEDNSLNGSEGSDIIIAGAGDDDISGAGGNDCLMGGSGDDTYLIGENSGNDVIVDVEGRNKIRFVDGITFSDVSSGLVKSGNDLILKIAGNENSVAIINFFSLANTVETFEFETGGQLTASQILGAFGLAAPTNTEVSKTLVFGDGAENALEGSINGDIMIAGRGDDTLSGLSGNDQLIGGSGDDVYVIGSNSGSDTIIDTAGTNIIRFIDNISFNDVASGLQKSGNDLILSIGSAGDQVRIENFFSLAGTIETLEFASGGQISAAQLFGAFGVTKPTATDETNDILSEVITGTSENDVLTGNASNNQLIGAEGDDVLIGGSGNDVLRGGAGNDQLNGGSGNDHYKFELGGGNDTILQNSAPSETDVLEFGDEISIEELWFSRDKNNLQINIIDSNDSVTISDWFSSVNNQVDEIEVGNSVLLNERVEQLVAAMASYNVPSGVGNVITQDTKDALQPILLESWQSK